MESTFEFTFWKSDFKGENLDRLPDILKQYAVMGKGYWFLQHKSHIRSGLTESACAWIMEHVANCGNTDINKQITN
jgi:hypothetical protein